MSFAFSSASSGESTGRTARTGPKTSFWTISESWAQSAMIVGRVEGAVRQTGDVRPEAAGHDRRAVGAGSLDEAVDALDLGIADERPEVRRGIERVADADALEELLRPGEERVVDGPGDVGPGRGGAVLAAVDERAGRRAARGRLDVGVGEDDERCLAAELEVDPLQVARGERLDPPARVRSRRSAR